MKNILLMIIPLFSLQAFAEDIIDLKKIHAIQVKKEAHQKYQAEFMQYNNYLKQDYKHNCYSMGSEEITLYLQITGETINKISSEVISSKMICFKKNYLNLPVKKPPFEPLIIKIVFK